MDKKLAVVRGGGDMATGVIYRLYKAGFKVIVLEIARPTVVRHTVAAAKAVFSDECIIEDMKVVKASGIEEAFQCLEKGTVPVLIDPAGNYVEKINPFIIIDAIMAKKNLGTKKEWAPIVLGLGPGFTAGKDVHAVVETLSGHYLGRVYYKGEAFPDTGVPGEVAGISREIVVRAPAAGFFRPSRKIGDTVSKGEVVGFVESVPDQEQVPVVAALTGTLRGFLTDGLQVYEGMKIGDVDPRQVRDYCWTISDKARAIGGGALEGILNLYHSL